MSLEHLCSRLAAGTAKYRPYKPFDPAELPDVWTSTAAIMRLINRSESRTAAILKKLFMQGILERRGQFGTGYEWRRIQKENNEHER